MFLKLKFLLTFRLVLVDFFRHLSDQVVKVLIPVLLGCGRHAMTAAASVVVCRFPSESVEVRRGQKKKVSLAPLLVNFNTFFTSPTNNEVK